MWWRSRLRERRGTMARLAAVIAVAGLAGGCFEPLYGTRPSVDNESVHDKLGNVEIPAIPAPKGQPVQRIAVELRNDLQFEFNNGAGAIAPTHRLIVSVGATQFTVIVDLTSGRPDALVQAVVASYQLVEIATGKVVVRDSTQAHVDFDIPGAAQRFAKQRAQRNAEDRATRVVAEAIRNRLASYFVAGT
jgi:LPS-assembly lipoprotein